MEKLSIGVIGVGHLGKLHSKMFKEISNCNFVGVFDSNQEQAKSVADEFGVKSFDSIDELLSNVKAVSVAATTTAHYEVAKKCFEKNIHVFVEKPITASIEEGELRPPAGNLCTSQTPGCTGPGKSGHGGFLPPSRRPSQ